MAIIKNPITVVESGETPVGPLDPQVVYQQTRPVDWMEMPTPANNELYLLVEVAKPLQEKDPGTPIGFQVHTSSTNYQVELGTVESGQFVADSTYTTTLASSAKYTNYAYYADWATHPMTNGNHQVMVKITPTSGNLTQFNHLVSVSGEEYGNAHTLEIRGHCEGLTRCIIGANNTNTSCALKYFSLEGTNSITTYFNSMFNGCHALTAVLQLDASHGTDFSRMFQACQSLVAIPQLDAGSGTNFEGMFYGCTDLVTIPLLDTSSGTNFGSMFQGCLDLVTIPKLNTSSGTNFGNMFQNCYSLTSIPLLDTSSGTTFTNMFYGCQALATIPLLDTSSGTSLGYMFYGCRSLTSIPSLNTSSGTNFSNMFNGCQALTVIPLLNTSHGTDFSSMFYGCMALHTIPLLDTSSGGNFSGMFQVCYSLTSIPLLDTSSGGNFSNMFNNCYSLKSIPLLNTSHGTNFSSMFTNCYVLTGVPLLDTSSGTSFSSMFQSCVSLTSIPPLDTSSGTNFSNMFNGCQSLIYVDFVGYDFTAVTAATSFISATYINGGAIMRIDDKFQMSGGGIDRQVVASPQGATAANPAFVVIEDENAMIPLGANATTVFSNAAYFYVVVPDSMYSTYSANSYWSSLGARLKKRSDVTLPTWYTS